jgi:hypothetical protein
MPPAVPAAQPESFEVNTVWMIRRQMASTAKEDPHFHSEPGGPRLRERDTQPQRILMMSE